MTPAALGYTMPAEWAPHRGTWLSWPHKEASWPGKFGPVPAIFARMVRHLAGHEEVHINVAGPDMEQEVRRLLADEGADTGNVFRYAGGGYMYNLSTKGLSTGTWQLRVDLGDGAIHAYTISIK